MRKYEKLLTNEGINSRDSFGWLSIVTDFDTSDSGRCGRVASNYENVRELGALQLFEQLEEVLRDQRDRVGRMKSFVYMNCVGNQLEKHFSRCRSEALAGTYQFLFRFLLHDILEMRTLTTNSMYS